MVFTKFIGLRYIIIFLFKKEEDNMQNTDDGSSRLKSEYEFKGYSNEMVCTVLTKLRQIK